MFEKLSREAELVLKELLDTTSESYWGNRFYDAEAESQEKYDSLWDCFNELKDAGMLIYDFGSDVPANPIRLTNKGKEYFSNKTSNSIKNVVRTIISRN